VITQAPGGRNAVQGEEFSFRCEATGTPPPSFVFYKVCVMTLLKLQSSVAFSHSVSTHAVK